MKFSIEDFFSKCDQIHGFLRISSHLLKKSLMENFIFCAVFIFLQALEKCTSISEKSLVSSFIMGKNLWTQISRSYTLPSQIEILRAVY